MKIGICKYLLQLLLNEFEEIKKHEGVAATNKQASLCIK